MTARILPRPHQRHKLGYPHLVSEFLNPLTAVEHHHARDNHQAAQNHGQSNRLA